MIRLFKNKRLLIVCGGVLLLVVAGVVAIVAQSARPKQDIAESNTSEQKFNENDTGTLEEEHIEDDGEEEHIEVNNQDIPTRVITESAVPVAETAALEYIKQSKSEAREQRQARLQSIFVSGSGAIYDEPPAVDPTHSVDASSSASVIYSRWAVQEQYVVVTVATKVTTVAPANSTKVVSEIYQGWNVFIVPDGTVYRAHGISISTIPIVVPR